MSNNKNHTITDIARLAGVTPGTVSRALNNNPLVNERTRGRILKIAEEVDYTPNLAGRRLSTGKTFAIGVIVPFFTRPSISERLDGVVSVLSNSHYDLVIHNVETSEQLDAGFRDICRRERIDGALILSIPIWEKEIEQIRKADIPVVLIDIKHPDLSDFSCVSVDDFEGGYKATKYLLEIGHTKIGFIGDVTEVLFSPVKKKNGVIFPPKFTSSHDRYNGYLRALQENGITAKTEYYAEEQYGYKKARELAEKMLMQPDPPTAIFASNDTQAFGVIQAARNMNMSIPEDLSVIGYDDIQAAEFMELTTIRQMLFESGRKGSEVLLEKMNGSRTICQQTVLPTNLIVRKSTLQMEKISIQEKQTLNLNQEVKRE